MFEIEDRRKNVSTLTVGDILRDINGLSYEILRVYEEKRGGKIVQVDDINSLQTVLYSLEQTINDDLAEIKSNIEHVQTIQKNNLRPQYPLY